MNKKLRKFLEQNGLRADATETEAWELYDKLQADGIELPGVNPGERAAAQPPAPNGAGDPSGTPQSDGDPAPPDGARSYDASEVQRMIDTQVAAGLEADRQRRTAVQDVIDVAGVAAIDGGNFARSILDNPHMDRARASEAILQRLSTESVPFGTMAQGAQVGTEAPEKLRAAVTDGLLMRSGIQVDEPCDGAREFRSRTLVGVFRELLEMRGNNTRGLGRRQLVERAMTATSTSDFSSIFSSVVNRVLLRAYDEWPQTWRQWVAVGEANDFRDLYSIKLSGAPDLQGIKKNGEYVRANFSDSGETYRVVTKGLSTALTREMIINDDLRAFTRVPALFGAAARRMENAAVYSLINSNPNMSDGTALFATARKNLAGTAAAISATSLASASAGMRTRKGANDEPLNIMPAFLLAPVIKETDAEILLRSAALPNADMSSGVHNPWAGKLTPVTDPLLDATSTTAWYLLAHPNQAPVIEVAWLEGEQQPYVEEDVKFLTGALEIGVRHDFGAGIVDHIGAYKNAGA